MADISKELLSEPIFHQEDLVLAVNEAIAAYNSKHDTTFSLKHVDLVFTPPVAAPAPAPSMPFDDLDDVEYCEEDHTDCDCPDCQGFFDEDEEPSEYEDGFADGLAVGYEENSYVPVDNQPDSYGIFITGLDMEDVTAVIQALASLRLQVTVQPMFEDEE